MAAKIAQLFEQISTRFEQLSERERRMVLLLLGGIMLMIVGGSTYFMVSSVSERNKNVESMRKNLAEILALESSYLEAKNTADSEKKKFSSNKISLFSLIQRTADSLSLTVSDLNQKDEPVPESELIKSSVTVNLKQLSIDKLTAFLEALEEGENKGLVKVLRLRAKKRYDKPDEIDASLTVATWKLG